MAAPVAAAVSALRSAPREEAEAPASRACMVLEAQPEVVALHPVATEASIAEADCNGRELTMAFFPTINRPVFSYIYDSASIRLTSRPRSCTLKSRVFSRGGEHAPERGS